MGTMHEVDYKIFGDDMQYVEIELDLPSLVLGRVVPRLRPAEGVPVVARLHQRAEELGVVDLHDSILERDVEAGDCRRGERE